MNSKKATAATMAILDEDMILEIVARLPLACAIRCMVLNKRLFRLISERKKALLSSMFRDIDGSIIHRYNDDKFERITPGSSKISITRTRRYSRGNPVIWDSCNGVLLLEFQNEFKSRICVFNPITGETLAMSPHVILEPTEVTLALAVDLDAQNSFQFKLVVAETLFASEEETLWRFTVYVPCGGTSWLIKSPVELICVGYPCTCQQFVYLHGCMYYAEEEHWRIIVFDVEKENVISIHWPRDDRSSIQERAFLSGSSDGSLQCVYVLKHEIEIHSYDQEKDTWQLKHKITNIVSRPKVLFCNGQHLLIKDLSLVWLRKKPEQKFLMYDISNDEWEKMDSSHTFDFRNKYFSFVPTLAKVSDKYLHDPDFEFEEVYLRGLQRLMMQEESDEVMHEFYTFATALYEDFDK